MDSRPEVPRELLPAERGALLAILDRVDADVHAALLVQAQSARVVGSCGCGCASVDLEVDRTAPPARGTSSPLPVHTVVRDAAGDEVGGVIVFLDDDGFLSLLEVYSWGEPISPFPPADRLECF